MRSIEKPSIGIGTGDKFWDAPNTLQAKIDLLRRAIDLGVGLIDTAEDYGDGQSEKIVSAAIRGCVTKPLIATKFSPDHCGYDDLIAAAERSLWRLGIECIDLYQMHWPNPAIPLSETMSALSSLIDQGKISQIGLCNVSPTQLQRAQAELGEHAIKSVQVEYNVFERTVEYSGLHQYMTERSIVLLAYSPLDQGRFAAAPEDQRSVLESIAHLHGVSVAQVVLNWLLIRGSATPIVRTTNIAHLIENIAATDLILDTEELAMIDQAFPVDIVEIPTEQIRVVTDREWGHDIYLTVDEARENRFDFVPSPNDLAKEVQEGDFLKPVRVVESTDSKFKYDLIGGRIRYWAWVIAHEGRRPIAAQIRKGI